MKPRTTFFSSFVISISRSGRSVSRNALARSSSSFSFSSSGVFFLSRSFFMRSRRASTCPRSLTIRSNSTLVMSRSGSSSAGVCNRVVFKGAQHVDQGIDSAQVGKICGLLQSLLPNRAHVGKLDLRVHQFARVALRGQPVEPVIGNRGDADVRLARVGAAVGDIRAGQNLEQRGLAHLGQAYDSSLHIDMYRFRFMSQQPALETRASSSMINERRD